MTPEDFYPVLALPLMVLLFTYHRLHYLLYLIVCAVVAGFDGVAVGSVYWALFLIPRFAMELFGVHSLGSMSIWRDEE